MKVVRKEDFTKGQIDVLNNIFQTCLLMQVSLHKLEACHGNVIFVRENKQRLSNTLKWIEQVVNELTRTLNLDESQEYITMVDTIEKFVSQIELKF